MPADIDKKKMPGKKIYVSIILPVHNEEENIDLQYDQLVTAVDLLQINYEIIFIDDGSYDRSYELLQNIAKKDKRIKLIQFRRNFGQTAAIAAGIEYSTGDIVIIMDADLQNDSEDIKNYIAKIEEGYDAVSGWRKERKDKLLSRKIVSKIANWLIAKVSGVAIHDLGSSQAYRGDIIRQVNLYGEMHRFIPIHASWFGAKITEIPVKHHERQFGKSKYGLKRAFKVLLDLITIKFMGSYSTKPIYLFGGTGVIALLLSIISGAFVIIEKLVSGKDMTDNPILYLTILLIILSVLFIQIGILAEILIRIYHESRNQRPYNVKEVVNMQ